jgi:hypothetical protein
VTDIDLTGVSVDVRMTMISLHRAVADAEDLDEQDFRAYFGADRVDVARAGDGWSRGHMMSDDLNVAWMVLIGLAAIRPLPGRVPGCPSAAALNAAVAELNDVAHLRVIRQRASRLSRYDEDV